MTYVCISLSFCLRGSPNVKSSPLPKFLLYIPITSVYVCLLEPCREAFPFQVLSPSSMPKFVTSVPGSAPCGPSCAATCSHCQELGWFHYLFGESSSVPWLGVCGRSLPGQGLASFLSSFLRASLEAILTPLVCSISELVYKKQGHLSSSPFTTLNMALPLYFYSTYRRYISFAQL